MTLQRSVYCALFYSLFIEKVYERHIKTLFPVVETMSIIRTETGIKIRLNT